MPAFALNEERSLQVRTQRLGVMLHVIASKITQPHEVLNLQAPKLIVAKGTALVEKEIAELIYKS